MSKATWQSTITNWIASLYKARNDEFKESFIKMSDTKTFEVTAKDLPLHCPTAEVASWSSHPRVFLDVAKTGEVACPYCGTKYKLKAGEQVGHH